MVQITLNCFFIHHILCDIFIIEPLSIMELNFKIAVTLGIEPKSRDRQSRILTFRRCDQKLVWYNASHQNDLTRHFTALRLRFFAECNIAFCRESRTRTCDTATPKAKNHCCKALEQEPKYVCYQLHHLPKGKQGTNRQILIYCVRLL